MSNKVTATTAKSIHILACPFKVDEKNIKINKVVKAFEELVDSKIIVDKNSHLMGAFGIAIMARECNEESVFNFDVDDLKLETKINQCGKCSNNCEIVTVYRNEELLDFWGNHCERGSILKNV